MDWGRLLVGQLEFYWDVHLWPRLQGLTDEEYDWQPAPPPVTTISWRMMHIAVGCFVTRSGAFFPEPGDPDAGMWDSSHTPPDLPTTAADGLAFLERSYRRWHGNIAGLDEAGLLRPLGRKGGGYRKDPMAALVVHINREVMHHGGEICLLRDLYAGQRGVAASSDPAASSTVG